MTEEQERVFSIYKMIKSTFENLPDVTENSLGLQDLLGLIAWGISKEFHEFDSSFPKDKEIHSILIHIDEENMTGKVHAVLK